MASIHRREGKTGTWEERMSARAHARLAERMADDEARAAILSTAEREAWAERERLAGPPEDGCLECFTLWTHPFDDFPRWVHRDRRDVSWTIEGYTCRHVCHGSEGWDVTPVAFG